MKFFYCKSLLRLAATRSTSSPRDKIYDLQGTDDPRRDLRSTRHLFSLQRATEHACCCRLQRSCRAFMIRMKSATCQRMCCPRGERAVTVQWPCSESMYSSSEILTDVGQIKHFMMYVCISNTYTYIQHINCFMCMYSSSEIQTDVGQIKHFMLYVCMSNTYTYIQHINWFMCMYSSSNIKQT